MYRILFIQSYEQLLPNSLKKKKRKKNRNKIVFLQNVQQLVFETVDCHSFDESPPRRGIFKKPTGKRRMSWSYDASRTARPILQLSRSLHDHL